MKETQRIRCDRCGLIYFAEENYPRPVYDLEYNEHFFRPGDIRKAGIMAALIAELIETHLGKTEVLEVGPGNGLTAFLLAKQNIKISVLDNDFKSCFNIIKDYEIPAYPGKFENSRFGPIFGFIYAGHVIEHSDEPITFFEKAHSSLKDNGLFFFDTPDTHYAKKHGINWKHFNTRNPYEHCCLFSLQTVEYIAKRTGFKIMGEVSLESFQSMQVLLRKK